jgi:ABC-type multidrug transport system permease subunit
VKVFVTIVTACFAIILFSNVDGTLQGVQNRNGALFFITMTIAFNAIQNTILIFPDERPVFLREVISEIPVCILTPVIFGSICYFAIGLSTVNSWTFVLFCKL